MYKKIISYLLCEKTNGLAIKRNYRTNCKRRASQDVRRCVEERQEGCEDR